MKKIFLIMLILAQVLQADFTRDEENYIVIDNETKLQWADNLNFLRNWNGAMAHCESFTLGEFTDWRVPNINELISIVDYTRSSPSLNPLFQRFKISNYWSSTTPRTSSNDNTIGLTVHFLRGSTGRYGKESYKYVRCVRGGL